MQACEQTRLTQNHSGELRGLPLREAPTPTGFNCTPAAVSLPVKLFPEMAISKIQILFPVIAGDIVLAGPDVVRNVASLLRLINGW